MEHKILFIDDDAAIRHSIKAFLEDEGFFVKTVASSDEGIALVRQNIIPFSLGLIDIHMPGMNGKEVIEKIRLINPELPLLGFSGDDSEETHNESLNSGALFFISKDTKDAKLLGIIHRICREVESKTQPLVVRDESDNRRLIRQVGMVGVSNALAKVADDILHFAPLQESVFIRGENGTGKEMVARAIHQNSPRRLMPFIAVNCGAIPTDLIESELFGHEKGSFTGATANKVGKFQAAHGGTLFLDEIGELPKALQPKLLRALQEKTITPVGSNQTKKVDVRIVTATNAPLEVMIEKNLFRPDLLYRINVLPITVPPLRSRPEDIPSLIEHFLQKANELAGKNKKILQASCEKLARLEWPGNVRELQHAITFLVNKSLGEFLEIKHLEERTQIIERKEEPVLDLDIVNMKRDLEEKSLILEALEKAGSNVTRAAEDLGIKRSTLRDKMRKYNIEIKGRKQAKGATKPITREKI